MKRSKCSLASSWATFRQDSPRGQPLQVEVFADDGTFGGQIMPADFRRIYAGHSLEWNRMKPNGTEWNRMEPNEG